MTELVWDGKKDKDGKRVAPVRIALPFQTVETVNESAQVRAHQLDLFSAGRATEWRNRLIWGDKKYVLPSLLPELAGKVNLIYIDPPFATGADFSFTTTIPDSDESFTKEPSMIEQKAYRDTWGKGLDSYLQWFYETAVMLRDLLADDGSLYVHLDWHVSHYAKAVLDEVFGVDCFLNEVIWVRAAPRSNVKLGMPAGHDTLLVYVRSENSTWNRPTVELREDYVNSHYTQVEPLTGRRFMLDNLVNPNPDRPNLKYEWNGVIRVWKVTRENMQKLHDQGRIVYTAQGVARYKRYLDESSGTPLTSVWQDIPPVNSQAAERVNYRTQKPEALLERIIRASSDEGYLVLDCFCGSGTTAAVAEKLGRRWIAADLGRFAIHTTRKRLLSIPNVRPFAVQNLGKYERQAWQVAEFAGGDATQAPVAQLAYRRFMLDLYRAQPLAGYTWLHGLRDGRLVHVGSVDSPVAVGDVQQIVKEFWRVRVPAPVAVAAGRDLTPRPPLPQGEGVTQSALATGAVADDALPPLPRGEGVARSAGGEVRSNGVDILGWEFAFELNEVARQMAAEAGVNLKFKRVPREVLEKKAVEQGDIKFFELAALSARVSQKDSASVDGVERAYGPHVTIGLTDFMVPTDDVPEDVIAAVKRWDQWIDYWAVDWDYKGDAFHNMSQTYRTRKDPQLQTHLAHTYEQPGTYTVVVKVIDILGNDTTRTLKVEVR